VTAVPPTHARRLGIDLGGTKIEGVVLDEHNRVIARHRVATERERGYDHIVSRVAELAERLRGDAPQCTRVGIGTPGSLSRRDGTLKNSNTTCLNGRRLLDDLRERLGMDVVIENDANCFALAEAIAGAGVGAPLVFGVILGTGVGGGIVHRGELLRGPQHLAGEWGHHSIDPAGPTCYCGHRGCVESLISGPAVVNQYRALGGTAADMQEVVAAHRAGEPKATEIVSKFIDRFGRAVANLIDILDPDVIVLGGGLSNVDELYTQGRDAVARYVFNDELRTPIRRHQLGDSAGVIGAALLV
jgi:fructokinase